MFSSSNSKYFFNVFFYLSMLIITKPITAQIRSESMNNKTDMEILSKLNAQFIKNYISQDTVAHNEIISKDFVCIEGNGDIVNRDEYMKDWAHSYTESGFTAFDYTDEVIRIFGNMALVRSKTVYTRLNDGKEITGNSLYTDTYIKDNGRWWCIQAQITPIKSR